MHASDPSLTALLRRRWLSLVLGVLSVWVAVAGITTCGCAAASLARSGGGAARIVGDGSPDAVLASALWHLENRPKLVRRDCSGLVMAILARAGIQARGNSRSFWQDAEREARVVDHPGPGDLAFFDRTYDANGNRQVDDLLTHVAVVLEADAASGSVRLVHFGSRQVKELRLSLSQPAVRAAGETVLNDPLREPGYGPADGPRLAGELLHGFARPPR